MFRRSQTTPLAADEASFIGDDDDDEQDNDPLLTQPPSLLNTVRSPSSLHEGQQPPSFLDSVCRAIDNESMFAHHNAEYTSPPSPPAVVIPDFVTTAIKNELLHTWGCSTPRPYQIEAIFHLVYTKLDMMYLIRKTGEGKSLVLQAMASILKGVTISMVPLLGLGSDQAEKTASASTTTLVESYHLDEFRNKNAIELRDRLNEYCREEKTAIMLFVSPQQLTKHSLWHNVLISLAQRGCVSGVCVDEAHCTVQNYESFRPEFKTAIDSINEIVGIARRNNPDTFYVPILAMSATFTISDQKSFNSLIGRLPTIVMWGDMSRRNISFDVDISGDPLNAFIKDWIAFMQIHPSRQSLVYSNTASSCDGSILNRLLSAQRKLPLATGDILSLTGECGVMLKSYLMACFCGETMDATPTNVQPTILRKILCMPCTSAANCGVSSNNCSACFRIGPPPSWHEMVQEMGRVDRMHADSEKGANSYKIYLNLTTFISLWCRVQSEFNDGVRARQMDELMDILTLLLFPQRCYHDAVERFFENPASYEPNPTCDNNCSFCTGSIMNVCGTVSKSQLISLLTTRVFDKGSVSAVSLVSLITSPSNKRVKAAIWGGKKNITAGNAHALILMLIASKIVQLELPTKANTNTQHTPLRDVQVSLRKQFAHADDEFETFSILIDENWKYIKHSP